MADSSALLAVLLGEEDAESFLHVMSTEQVLVSAATVTEARIVAAARLGTTGPADLDQMLAEVSADIVAYTDDHATVAHLAWQRCGRGQHPAKLNFGDCMSYATAKVAGAPLLFKGDDFSQTDVSIAL